MLDIDVAPTQTERARIAGLISAELPAKYETTLHPSVPFLPAAHFPEMIQKELDRKSGNQPIIDGIDLSRYEAPEPPVGEGDMEVWSTALQKAYASSSYLSGRLSNLALLDELGRNAWLISNSQLEDILRDLERKLAALKEATENVNKARKSAQEGSKGEILGLEETWRRGVGKIIEVQVATEGLRREGLERRRRHAN